MKRWFELPPEEPDEDADFEDDPPHESCEDAEICGRQEGQYHYDDIKPIPFSTIHVDHLGPFPKSSKRNEHILVIVDAFTKFTIVRAVKSTATKHVLDVLQDVTSYLGMPDRIVTDRGTAFTSKDFEKANGHAERTNRIILSMLLPSNDIDKRWDDNIRSIQWSINTMLLYGYEPRDILKNAITNIIQSQDQKMLTDVELDQLRADAARTVNDHRAAAKKRYDAKHAKPTVYSLGDLVLVENEKISLTHNESRDTTSRCIRPTR
ncbi:uncharacterized protein [Drosophila suzukii]|uniref:Integrase catalytic domain-containing protein n=1 Tax=Drosophila suzukii TaxID=28584 RepID=A0ABM4TYF5_DROSZ